MANQKDEAEWFDERREANVIASKVKYDDIYDAALSAFKKLSGVRRAVVDDADCNRAQPHCSEWTPERLIGYLDIKVKDGSFKDRMQLIANDINTEIAAERQRHAKLEKLHTMTLERYLTNEQKRTRQQLLSALAAIEKHNKRFENDAIRPNVEIKYDPSLLNQHDAEVRKPLMDLMKHIITTDAMDMTRGEIISLLRDALAKVKEGK